MQLISFVNWSLILGIDWFFLFDVRWDVAWRKNRRMVSPVQALCVGRSVHVASCECVQTVIVTAVFPMDLFVHHSTHERGGKLDLRVLTLTPVFFLITCVRKPHKHMRLVMWSCWVYWNIYIMLGMWILLDDKNCLLWKHLWQQITLFYQS